ncbi:15208_t:CDS:2 [Gigaspora margarita]|uniref:15208_t:CDS:1 n=1 Tax=Gigaspora margarita TaxID=4874 RepID=A0ABM8W1T7_GIGMA|nr:15208_t:CDS:2 [Gigaspora margarita]
MAKKKPEFGLVPPLQIYYQESKLKTGVEPQNTQSQKTTFLLALTYISYSHKFDLCPMDRIAIET